VLDVLFGLFRLFGLLLVLVGGIGCVGPLLLLSLLTAFCLTHLILCFETSLGACVLCAAVDKAAVESDPLSARPSGSVLSIPSAQSCLQEGPLSGNRLGDLSGIPSSPLALWVLRLPDGVAHSAHSIYLLPSTACKAR
jgi:hypothetical protein